MPAMVPQSTHGADANLAPAMGAGPQAFGTVNPTSALTSTMAQATSKAHKSAAPPSTNASIATSEVPESSNHGAQKSKGKSYCYHCHTKGHTMAVCTVLLCCDICYGDHVTKICPNMKKMNTTAIPCGYAVEGLSFYFIPVAEIPS
jgi:hypothetical protein